MLTAVDIDAGDVTLWFKIAGIALYIQEVSSIFIATLERYANAKF